MDGYAVAADDLTGPWRVIGESAAGHPFAGELSAGEAIRISTGALMPAGGGAVLLQEDAIREGDSLQLSRSDRRHPAPHPPHGVRFPIGRPAAGSGNPTRRGPTRARHRRRAWRIAGRQARNSARHRQRGRTRQRSRAGARPTRYPPAMARCSPRWPHRLRASAAGSARWQTGWKRWSLPSKRRREPQVIVTSGGASVGDHDLIRPALEAWGATIDFWRIALRPGKPLLVARKGEQIVLGLPGNPVSSYVTAFLFLLPLLRHLAGASSPLPRSIGLPLAGNLPETGPRTEFFRAALVPAGVMPFDQRDSSALRSLAAADALIARPAGAPAAAAGAAGRGFSAPEWRYRLTCANLFHNCSLFVPEVEHLCEELADVDCQTTRIAAFHPPQA